MKFTETLLLVALVTKVTTSFQPLMTFNYHHRPSSSSALNYAVEVTESSSSTTTAEAMKLGNVKAELKHMGVSYKDCFDQEALIKRLQEARQRSQVVIKTIPATSLPSTTEIPQHQLDAESILVDLRSQELKNLKLQCSRRNLRYAGFSDKEDFVQAIWNDMQKVARFSASGALRPGKALDLTGDELDQEIMTLSATTPILVDVYATWCGPCKMQAPIMDSAAADLGDNCRVAKLDSDKHHEWAGKYKVQGLPTTLLIHNGEIKARLEGAVMKDKLLDMVKPYLNQ